MNLQGVASLPTGAVFVAALFFGGAATATACGTAPFVFDVPTSPKITAGPDATGS